MVPGARGTSEKRLREKRGGGGGGGGGGSYREWTELWLAACGNRKQKQELEKLNVNEKNR